MPPNQRRFYAVSPCPKSPLCSSGTAHPVHPERDGDYGGTELTMRSPSGDGGDSGRSRPAHFASKAGRVLGEMVLLGISMVHRWRKAERGRERPL